MKNVKLLIGCLVSSIFIILHAQTFICAQTPTDVIAPQEVHVVTNAVNHELTAGMLDSTVVVFNDIHLEAAVRDVLGKPTGDIYDVDMAALVSFTATKDSIFDLTGLEYAVNLAEIDLGGNMIEEVTPLQGLGDLVHLSLYTNEIKDLSPLQGLPRVSFLNLNQNQISDISALPSITSLTTLFLSSNPIGDFTPLRTMNGLLTLMLNSLDLTDISMLQNLQQLRTLYLESNLLTDITPLQNMDQLILLYIGSNSINDLTPLQNLTNLENIKLSYNQISDISPLRNLTNLSQLILGVNQIHDITDVQNLTKMKSLLLRDNQIEDITPVQSLMNLTHFQLGGNKITDISAVRYLTALTYLHITDNPIQDIDVLRHLTKLEDLWAYNIQLRSIAPLRQLTELEKLGLDANRLDNEDLTDFYNFDKLTMLRLGGNPGINSGTAVEQLAGNLNLMVCEDIDWDGICGVDSSLAVICWCDPSDSADVGQTVTVQATATDSEQARVQMKIDWNDGNVSDYSGLKNNAGVSEFTHDYDMNGVYDIRVMAKNEQNVETDWSMTYRIVVGKPVVSVETAMEQTGSYSLSQNSPNPFNSTTVLRYDLPQSAYVNISIYDMRGRRVKVLENSIRQRGLHTVRWAGEDEHGNPQTSGIYFCRMHAGQFWQSVKLVLIK